MVSLRWRLRTDGESIAYGTEAPRRAGRRRMIEPLVRRPFPWSAALLGVLMVCMMSAVFAAGWLTAGWKPRSDLDDICKPDKANLTPVPKGMEHYYIDSGDWNRICQAVRRLTENGR